MPFTASVSVISDMQFKPIAKRNLTELSVNSSDMELDIRCMKILKFPIMDPGKRDTSEKRDVYRYRADDHFWVTRERCDGE